MDPTDRPDRSDANKAAQPDDVELPSINADRTPPYRNPVVNEVAKETYGAAPAEAIGGDDVIAPTFSDTEPGAGPNYGASGDPDAPNLGGIEDETTLGPDQVRPSNRQLVHEGEFETRAAQPASAGAGAPSGGEPAPPPQSAAGQLDGYPGASRENPLAAPGGASPQVPLSPRTNAAPGHGNNLGGEGAYAPKPLPGEATQGAASMANPTTDRISKANLPGSLPADKLTYGNPQAYAGDGDAGRTGTSSGSAGELPGGHMIDLAHGGGALRPDQTDPDVPSVAPTALDGSEPARGTGPSTEPPDPPNQTTLTP